MTFKEKTNRRQCGTQRNDSVNNRSPSELTPSCAVKKTPPPDEPWLLPTDHPDWEPESSGPDEMSTEEQEDDESGSVVVDDESERQEEWQSAGYYSYSSWWENEGYMTHPARPEGDDDDRG